jgi:hypothetical protein
MHATPSEASALRTLLDKEIREHSRVREVLISIIRHWDDDLAGKVDSDLIDMARSVVDNTRSRHE